MTKNNMNGHREGARSATDTLTGSGIAGLALIGIRIFLGTKGIVLEPEELLAVGGALTGILTGVSSYVHGYIRGKKAK